MNLEIEHWNTPRFATTTVHGSKWDLIGIWATAAAAQSFSGASLAVRFPSVAHKAINTIDTFAV